MIKAKDLAKQLQEAKIGRIPLVDAKQLWKDFRLARGYKGYADLLTSPESNYKLNKSANEAAIYGLSLAPAFLSEKYNVCRRSTAECRKGCVAFAGKGELPNIAKARITKVEFLAEYPDAFMTILSDEITKAKAKLGDKLAVRLNTFSDLPWESIDPKLFKEHKDVQFYDYTKWRVRRTPKNYHLTYSASDKTRDDDLAYYYKKKKNIAVVFGVVRGHDLPETYKGIKVIDGDTTDARFLDEKGVIVGLRAKGRMRKGNWKMVRKVPVTN